MSDSVETVKQLRKYIEKNITLERKVIKALDTLNAMKIGLDVLQVTGIGRYINGLKHVDQLSEAVIEKAKALVMKWKAAVNSKDDGRNTAKKDGTRKPSDGSDRKAASDGSDRKAASAIVSVTVEETRKGSHSREGRSYMEHVTDTLQPSKHDDNSRKRSFDKELAHEGRDAKRLRSGEAEEAHTARLPEEKPVRVVTAVATPEKRRAATADADAVQTTGRPTFSSSKHSRHSESSTSRNPQHRSCDNVAVVSPASQGVKSEAALAPTTAADGGSRVLSTRLATSDGISELVKKRSQHSPPAISQAAAAQRRSSSSSGDGCGSDSRDGSGGGALKRKRAANVGSTESDASDDDSDRPKGAQTFEEMLAYDAEVIAKKSSIRKKKMKTGFSTGDSKLRAAGCPTGTGSGTKSGKLVKEVVAGGAVGGELLDRPKKKTTSAAEGGAALAGTPSNLPASSSARDKSMYGLDRPSHSDGGLMVPPPPPPVNRLNISTADIMSSLPDMGADYRPAATNTKKPAAHSSFGKGENIVVEAFEPGSKQHSHTMVYSGRKQRTTEVSSLFDLSMRVLMNNIDSIGYVGHVPCSILMPVLKKCTSRQLLVIEYYNPVFEAETGELWKKHCQRDFAGQEPEEFESWREMYQRLQEAQERRVEEIAAKVAAANKLKAPERKTKLAYMDSIAKPPREVRRMQQKLGTAASSVSVVRTPASTSASATGRTNTGSGSASGVRGDVPRPAPIAAAPPAAASPAKPRAPVKTVAPLMKQVLKFAKGAKR